MQLLASVLAILQDASLLMSLQLSNAPVDGAELASSDTKQYKVSKKGQKKKKEETEKAQLEKNKSSTFHCALQALISMLRAQVSLRSSVDVSSSSSSASTPSFPCQILPFRIPTDLPLSTESVPACLSALQTRLVSLFHDISSVEEGFQPRYLLIAMRKLVTALQLCHELWSETSCPLLAHFPYACSEIARHTAGSVDYALLMADTELLNLDLCDLFLGSSPSTDGTTPSLPSASHSPQLTSVEQYLLSTLQASVQALRTDPSKPDGMEEEGEDFAEGRAKLRELQITLVARIFSSMSQNMDRQDRLPLEVATSFLHEMDQLFTYLASSLSGQQGEGEALSTAHRLVVESAIKALCSFTRSVSGTGTGTTETNWVEQVVTVWTSLPPLLFRSPELLSSRYLFQICIQSLRHLLIVLDCQVTSLRARLCAECILDFFQKKAFMVVDTDLQLSLIDLLAYFPADVWRSHLPGIAETVQRSSGRMALERILTVFVLRLGDLPQSLWEETLQQTFLRAAQQEPDRAQEVAVLVAQCLVNASTEYPIMEWVHRCMRGIKAIGEDGLEGNECAEQKGSRDVCVMALFAILLVNLPSKMLREEGEEACAFLLCSVTRYLLSLSQRHQDWNEPQQVDQSLLLPTTCLVALFAANETIGSRSLTSLLNASSSSLPTSRLQEDESRGVNLLYVLGLLLRRVKAFVSVSSADRILEVVRQWAEALRAKFDAQCETQTLQVACNDMWTGLLD